MTIENAGKSSLGIESISKDNANYHRLINRELSTIAFNKRVLNCQNGIAFARTVTVHFNCIQ